MFPFLKKKKEEPENLEPIESTLSILMEAPKNGLVQYLEENGIKVESIMYNIEEAQYDLMASTGVHKRLVIIESGLGLFNKSEARELLYDILGMVDNVKLDATFVYSDSSLKSYLYKKLRSSKSEADIDFVEFESLGSIAKALSKYNEIYNTSGAYDEEIQDPLEFKGKKVEIVKNYFDAQFKDDDVLKEYEQAKANNVESIQGFDTAF